MGSTLGKFFGMLLVLALVLMAGGFLIYLFEEAVNNGFEMVVMGLFALAGMAWIVFRGPIGKAIAGLLEGHSTPDAMLSARVADLEDRLQELTLESQRFLEIEERLDFTERLLTQQDDALPRGEA